MHTLTYSSPFWHWSPSYNFIFIYVTITSFTHDRMTIEGPKVHIIWMGIIHFSLVVQAPEDIIRSTSPNERKEKWSEKTSSRKKMTPFPISINKEIYINVKVAPNKGSTQAFSKHSKEHRKLMASNKKYIIEISVWK